MASSKLLRLAAPSVAAHFGATANLATAGLAAAAALTRVMKSLLFGVAPMDPMTFAAVPVALLLATLAASYIPARRVSAVDPMNCLRAK